MAVSPSSGSAPAHLSAVVTEAGKQKKNKKRTPTSAASTKMTTLTTPVAAAMTTTATVMRMRMRLRIKMRMRAEKSDAALNVLLRCRPALMPQCQAGGLSAAHTCDHLWAAWCTLRDISLND